MALTDLSLNRFVVANYKSIKRIELGNLNNFSLFMGRNNAGKSNILDSFKYLADAAISFDTAHSTRGGDHAEVVHRKRESERIEFTFEFAIDPEKRNQ